MQKEKNGFTLIELLVILSIIILVSAGIGMALNLGNPKSRVKVSSRALASDLKRARDLTLNRKIDKQCEEIYGQPMRGQCSRYKLVLGLGGNDGQYALLPQAVIHEDASLVRSRFPGAIRSLSDGAKILSPQKEEAFLFEYAPSQERPIEVRVAYSGSPLGCDLPSDVLGPVVISDDKEQHKTSMLVDCRGMVIMEEETQ